MPTIEHFFHLVPELPLGAAVLVVDENGRTHTYLSDTASREDIAADLAWVRTVQAEDYCLKGERLAG